MSFFQRSESIKEDFGEAFRPVVLKWQNANAMVTMLIAMVI